MRSTELLPPGQEIYEQRLCPQRSDEQQRIGIKEKHDDRIKGIAMLGHAT
jgi:hypothetical protein